MIENFHSNCCDGVVVEVLSQLAASPGSGVARLIFLGQMVSTNIQGLSLSDKLGEKLLMHLKVEMCDVAMGMSPGTAAPIHSDTLLTLMLELLVELEGPYENSDKSDFSEEGLHSFLRKLNDEIIEERRIEEPPGPEPPNQTLMQIQETLGQVVDQLKGISRTVQRHEELLNSHGTTDQSRVKDRSFECPDPKYTSLQICLGGEREPALDRSIVFTPLDRIFDQVMDLAFLKGDELRPEMRSFQDLIRLGNDNILQNLIIPPGETEDRRFPSIISQGGLQFRPPERGSICYIEPEFEEFSSFDHARHMSENVSIFLNSLQEVSIVNGRLVRGAEDSGSILRGHCAYLRAAAHLKAQVVSAFGEDSFGLEEHLRKQAAQETLRDDSAELQPHRPSMAEVAAPSKRGPSAFILAYLIETELNLPSREDLTCFL